MLRSTIAILVSVACGFAPAHVARVRAADTALPADAAAALKKAVDYYTTKVAVHGGYVYHTTPDLSVRWGEGLATKSQIWVQPPATPTVGLALLKAYEATGDAAYLAAAKATGEALIYGQLKSGGWTNFVDFDPESKAAGDYRNGRTRGKGSKFSTLDDGIGESAIQFLAHLDQALKFEDAAIHQATLAALDALLAAQFPNGAFPQGWTGPVPSQPVVKPNYPDYDWRTEGRVKNYWDMYNLNDGIAGYTTAALIDAWSIYKDDRYKQAVLKLGEFLILAQMPEPQPAWCQQYGYDMRPIWARKFEPPAVTGRESQDVMETLIRIADFSGDKKYLEPIPAALAYLKRSLLPDGRLSRYYELRTNKPLYMTRQGEKYSLTYDDSRLPDHYGWKTESFLARIEQDYRRASAGSPPSAAPPLTEAEVRAIVTALDAEGRWIDRYAGQRLVGQPKFAQGAEFISSETFSRNVTALADYLLAQRIKTGVAR